MTNTPERKLRSGELAITVWKNVSEKGEYNTVQLQRSYKDSQTDEWKSTTSLREKDLPKAALLLQKTYEELCVKEQEIPPQEKTKK